MKDKAQPAVYHIQTAGTHSRPVHITPLYTLHWTSMAWSRQGKHRKSVSHRLQHPARNLAFASLPSSVLWSTLWLMLVLSGADRSFHHLGWVSQGALDNKCLLLLPGCATLLPVLRQCKRHTRDSLLSSCKDLFQSRNLMLNSVPHQSVQPEFVKILPKEQITTLATILSFKAQRPLILSKVVRVWGVPFVLKEIPAGDKIQRSQHWVTTWIRSQKF